MVVGGSQSWLHSRITCGTFMTYQCQDPTPDRLTQDLSGGAHTPLFARTPQVTNSQRRQSATGLGGGTGIKLDMGVVVFLLSQGPEA